MHQLFKLFFLPFLLASTLGTGRCFSQQNHFLYIQADDKQPFNVTVNGNTYTSSEIGYVIIPKLTEGKYQLSITFPENKYPDQNFTCSISKSDAGYALKNLKDKGWGLFNFQTLEVTLAGAPAPEQEEPKDTANPNAFGEMLSDVMNDSTLKKAAIDLQEAEKQRQQDAIAQEREKAEKERKGNNTLNDSLLNGQSGTSPATVMKIAQYTTGAGTSMVFVDKTSGDTIRIFLPKEQETARKTATETSVTKNDTVAANNTDTSVATVTGKEDTATVAIVPQDNTVPQDTIAARETTANAAPGAADSSVAENEQPVTEADNNQSNTQPLADTSATVKQPPNNPFYKEEQQPAKNADTSVSSHDNSQQETAPATASPGSVKEDCKKMFAEDDLDKVKKKMISASTDEKMIQTAKKYFQDKCVTTDQVKSLGGLFLTDDGRYHFFEAVFKNVYDIGRFPSLENQLIDPYYKKRFNAMLK